MASHSPRSKRVRSSPILIIGGVCINLLTHTMLYGFILPVLPTALVERESIPADKVSRWIGILLTVEGLATLLASPFVGYWTKLLRNNQRLSLLTGILLLGVAMTIIAVSRSIGVLVTGRIVQGISSAIIQVVSVTVVLACSPEDAVGQLMGYAGAAMNLGFLAGPLLGGVLYQFLDWSGLFGVVGGILALNLVVPLVILPVDRPRMEDLSSPTQSPLMTDSTLQLDASQVTAPFSVLILLRESKMRIGLCAVIVSGVFISAIDTVLPVFVENKFHWNSLAQGLVFLPVSVPALLEPIYGWLTDKYGARIVGFLSFLALVPSSICLRLVTSNSMDAKILLCGLLVCIGLFLDATEPAGYVLMDDVLDELQNRSGRKYDWKDIVARSFGVQNASHYFGITIGPVIILALPESGRLGEVGLLLGCLSAVTALLWIWGVKDPVDFHESGGEEDEVEMATEIRVQPGSQESKTSAAEV